MPFIESFPENPYENRRPGSLSEDCEREIFSPDTVKFYKLYQEGLISLCMALDQGNPEIPVYPELEEIFQNNKQAYYMGRAGASFVDYTIVNGQKRFIKSEPIDQSELADAYKDVENYLAPLISLNIPLNRLIIFSTFQETRSLRESNDALMESLNLAGMGGETNQGKLALLLMLRNQTVRYLQRRLTAIIQPLLTPVRLSSTETNSVLDAKKNRVDKAVSEFECVRGYYDILKNKINQLLNYIDSEDQEDQDEWVDNFATVIFLKTSARKRNETVEDLRGPVLKFLAIGDAISARNELIKLAEANHKLFNDTTLERLGVERPSEENSRGSSVPLTPEEESKINEERLRLQLEVMVREFEEITPFLGQFIFFPQLAMVVKVANEATLQRKGGQVQGKFEGHSHLFPYIAVNKTYFQEGNIRETHATIRPSSLIDLLRENEYLIVSSVLEAMQLYS